MKSVVDMKAPDWPAPSAPSASPAPPRRGPWLTVVVVVVAVVLAVVAAIVLTRDDGGGPSEPTGGPLAGRYEAAGTNPDGSPYQGTAVITGDGPRYRIAWSIGSSTSSGRGTLEGNRITVAFNGEMTGRGTATYRLQEDGSLVGTWSVEGGTGEGTETLTPA